MNNDLSWINSLSCKNLGAVYSVLLDIKERAEFDLEEIEIPLLAPHNRSDLLYPEGGIRTADDEGELRERTLNFLEKKCVIQNLYFDPGLFTSETSVTLRRTSPAMFDEVLTNVEAAFQGTRESESSKRSVNIDDFWHTIHPKITEIARPRFEAKHLADAVEAAAKEVNDRVKSVVKTRTGKDDDGSPLMKQAFSLNNPIISLADLSTKSGQSEQVGYMEIFSGTMTGIRNPKAHSNLVIDEKRAIHLLYLTSLLMYKLDEAK
ncbi:MAG: TIGR02391 family protein [Nitrospirota bacterium]